MLNVSVKMNLLYIFMLNRVSHGLLGWNE